MVNASYLYHSFLHTHRDENVEYVSANIFHIKVILQLVPLT